MREDIKEGSDQLWILRSNMAASDLVSLFLALHHMRETDPVCRA